MTAVGSARSVYGIALESTPGTPVAPTDYLVLKSPLTSQPVIAQLADEGLRASRAKTYGIQPGPTHVTVDMAGNVFPDTIGYPIVGILGDVTVTGAGAPYQHAVGLLNSGQPPSYTVTDDNKISARSFAGLKWAEFGLKWAPGGLLEWSGKTIGMATASASSPTASFSSVVPAPTWQGVMTIAGSPVTYVEDGSLDIKVSVTAIENTDGSQAPLSIFAGGDLAVTGAMNVVMDSSTGDTVYGYYLNGTQIAFDYEWTTGAGAGLTTVKFHMTTVQVTNATVSRGKDYVELSLNYEAIANATDVGASGGSSPVKATVKNAVPSGRFK